MDARVYSPLENVCAREHGDAADARAPSLLIRENAYKRAATTAYLRRFMCRHRDISLKVSRRPSGSRSTDENSKWYAKNTMGI